MRLQPVYAELIKPTALARLLVPLLYFSGAVAAQSTLATFQLSEYFGVTWPTQNIEMRYDDGSPNIQTTRMLANGVEIPYQWISGAGCWDTTAVKGCILVQDGLAGNTTNTYTLQSGVAPSATVRNPVTVTAGTCQGGMTGWIIANGLTGFCVPQTQSAPYNLAPVQGIQLTNGAWTGAAAGTPNLIYHNAVSGVWPGSYALDGMPGGVTNLMRTPATIFTGETTRLVDAGPLKTSVQLSYTANKPVFYTTGVGTIVGSTASTITLNYIKGYYDCNTPVLFFSVNSPPLPTPLQTNTPYYTSNCVVSGSQVSYSLSSTPSGTPISNLGRFQGQVQGVLNGVNGSGAGHLTVALTLYANRPAFSFDFDTDLSIQYFVPVYAEIQPNTRRYRGHGATSARCGYESPLTITNITNTTPPTVTVANQLNAVNGYQIDIAGVNGATGANGTFYTCAVSKVAKTFTLHKSGGCNSPAPAPGVYTSGGISKPQYTLNNLHPPRDAFYDVSYSGNYLPAANCTASTIAELGINYDANWNDAGYYDMVYSSSMGGSAPVIGLFEGRLSKVFNAAGTGQPGWFSSNNHWIPQENVSCSSSTGTCAFGIEHIIQLNTRATTVHGNFGIYVGTVGQLLPQDATQQIKREQNVFQGINLSSLYTYALTFLDPQPNTPPNNGWTWPYMNASDFNNWVSLFQHSASFCASTGDCSGDTGFYSKIIAVQDRTSRSERPLKAGRLGCGMECFQDEVSMSGSCEPVQVIRELESVVPAAGPAAGFASDHGATWSTPGK